MIVIIWNRERYQEKLQKNLKWHDSESQVKYKERLVRTNQVYANIDLSQCIIKPIKYESRVQILMHKNIATDDIETKLKELMMMQEYDLKHFQVKDEL